MLLSRHEFCRIYSLFWSDFDADFYADIEDFEQISVLLLRHKLFRIYALFWFDFDADFYADIEDFVQLLCRSLHEKMLGGTSDPYQ